MTAPVTELTRLREANEHLQTELNAATNPEVVKALKAAIAAGLWEVPAFQPVWVGKLTEQGKAAVNLREENEKLWKLVEAAFVEGVKCYAAWSAHTVDVEQDWNVSDAQKARREINPRWHQERAQRFIDGGVITPNDMLAGARKYGS
jgi:hypothetical protein